MESIRKQRLFSFVMRSSCLDTNADQPRQLYILTDEEEEYQSEELIETIQEENQEPDGKMFMHALTGSIIHHAIRIQGLVKKQAIIILIDNVPISS